MIVLGIHCGHDSSAAILRDGEILADAAEERFTRLKHCNHVPTQAMSYCLSAAGLKNINEVDYIAFPWKRTPKDLRVVLGIDKSSPLRHMVMDFLGFGIPSECLQVPLYFPDFRLWNEGKLINVEHHLAHAASAYFTRPANTKCLIFTVDGAGDEVSTAVWLGEGNRIMPLEQLYREASIGWAYSIVTEALHWWHGDGEGKTMGLAPYGDRSRCAGALDWLFPQFRGTSLIRPTRLGPAYYWVENGSTQFHFDEAYEVERLAAGFGRENIAAEAQYKLEDCLKQYIFGWAEKEQCRRLAFSGGVFLNVKLNQRIWNERADLIEEQHIFPNCGDSGLALGAALYVYYQYREFQGTSFDRLSFGPEFSNQEIEQLLKERKLNYTFVKDPGQVAASLLAENKIIGWFQGRMESGPRALGNRSILMSPLKAENKDIINQRVKFRESFRPFCPSLLWEKAGEYLQDFRDEYFMITSFDVKPEKRDRIPAVVHVDGTVRPQMVRKEANPLYWELIHEFGKLTGEYILLNTSFNIKGEPIINHPREAIRCFFDTGLDALFLGNFVLEK
ncbi:MAG: carbamoyltransferase C-terminal domain-containing protein [bacterium]